MELIVNIYYSEGGAKGIRVYQETVTEEDISELLQRRMKEYGTGSAIIDSISIDSIKT